MNQNFNQFISQDKQQFLDDFSVLSGVPENEFEKVEFRKGCVIFEIEIDEQAVERLIEAYEKRNCMDPESIPQLEELKAFIAKYKVASLTDDLSLKFTIRTSKKTSSRQLIFVHGWRGDAASFGKMPEILSDLTKCESFIYEFPTGIWESSPPISMISKNLDNWVRNQGVSEKVAIICHSMGGLITRDFVLSQIWRNHAIDTNIKQITFVASPHVGVPLAKLAKHVPTLRKAQIADLRPDSPFLVELNNRWAQWSRRNVPKNCITRSIYGLKDDVVDPNYAIGDDPEAIPILDATHIDIVKPQDENSEIVRTIIRLLSESQFGIA